jgi:hypothetical protein
MRKPQNFFLWVAGLQARWAISLILICWKNFGGYKVMRVSMTCCSPMDVINLIRWVNWRGKDRWLGARKVIRLTESRLPV